MDTRLTPQQALDAARETIARSMVGNAGRSALLGEIELRPHQVDGAQRLAEILARDGGALLADHVGLGKTFVALAVAQRYARPLVIAPALVCEMWDRASRRAGVPLRIVSMALLSRHAIHVLSDLVRVNADLVIIDEAHHFRNSATRRYAAAALLTARAHVLLLSATPLQNRRADIAALFGLFLGSRAKDLGATEVAQLIVRRASAATGIRLPRIEGPFALYPPDDEACVAAILAVPPPVVGRDEQLAGALTTFLLLHMWTSSRAALVTSLKRRRARAIAVIAGLEAGRLPTRREQSAWAFDGVAVQLAFPELAIEPAQEDSEDIGLALNAARRFDGAIGALLSMLRDSDPDATRAAMLDGIRARHSGARVVAFSQYAETVAMYGRMVRDSRGVAVLTANGGRDRSGLSRRDVLAQFVPSSTAKSSAATRVDLLLTTDLLSEGVDLHAASVVVNLDLPWNPARVEQRVGRLRRIGSPHARIAAYTMMPPASADRLLSIEARLADKLALAASVIGAATVLFPQQPTATHTVHSPVELAESTRALLGRWLSVSLPVTPANARAHVDLAPIVAAVRCSRAGFLALIRSDGNTRLVAMLDQSVSTAPHLVHEAVRLAMSPVARATEGDLTAALDALQSWWQRERVTLAAPAASLSHDVRRAALRRIADITRLAPRHRRTALFELASAARVAVDGRLGASAEAALGQLCRDEMAPDDWLRAVAALAAETSGRQAGDDLNVVALIVFKPN